jgi:hypothetical protein
MNSRPVSDSMQYISTKLEEARQLRNSLPMAERSLFDGLSITMISLLVGSSSLTFLFGCLTAGIYGYKKTHQDDLVAEFCQARDSVNGQWGLLSSQQQNRAVEIDKELGGVGDNAILDKACRYRFR